MNYVISLHIVRRINKIPIIPIVNFTNKNKHSASLQTSQNDYTREFYFLILTNLYSYDV